MDILSQLTSATYRSFAPYSLHPTSHFEGFYTKLTLPSGSSLILIICSVPRAVNRQRAHNVTLTIVPADRNKPIWQRELFVDDIRAHRSVHDACFSLHAVHHGRVVARMHASSADSMYEVVRPGGEPLLSVSVEGRSADVVAWDTPPSCSTSSPATASLSLTQSCGSVSPESILRFLPLPLHWHVHRLSAPATYKLELPHDAPKDLLPLCDFAENAVARVHEEKNWAHGFPSAHIWVCARDEERGISLVMAGGRTMGLDAALCGLRVPAEHTVRGRHSSINNAKGNGLYRKQHEHETTATAVAWDFRPPFSINVPLLTKLLPAWLLPGVLKSLSLKPDYNTRTLRAAITTPFRRFRVQVSADREAARFFSFADPQPQGFQHRGMAETLDATVVYRAEERRGFRDKMWAVVPLLGREQGWSVVAEGRVEGAGLEFGGGYYPEARMQQKDSDGDE